MRLTKHPLEKGVYILPSDFRESHMTEELGQLAQWLATTGKEQYKVPSVGMIQITNPKIELMFVLRWLNK